MCSLRQILSTVLVGTSLLIASSNLFAQGVTPELALQFKPIQSGVEIDTPEKAEIPRCKVEVVQTKQGSGWIVFGPSGEMLRRFMDTNKDNTVDQWSYYQGGLEVYRDNDGNFNKKVDQSRWLNTGGTRWGIDRDEDGEIDAWKQISVEEAAEVAFQALYNRDAAFLQTVMLTQADIKALGVTPALSKELSESTADVPSKMSELLRNTKQITKQTKWLRFDAGIPGAIPEDAGKASQDLSVYENARALIDNDGSVDLLQIGELVLVGNSWKLTQMPQPLDRESGPIEFGGILLRTTAPTASGEVMAPVASSDESREILDALQKLDENAPSISAGPTALGQYNRQRADLLQKLVSLAKTEEERLVWLKQMVDGIAAAIQTNAYPEGLDRLQSIERAIQKTSPNSEVLSYVTYRRLTSEYSRRAVSTETEKQGEVQTWWLESLESFVKKYPKSDEAPDAAFQIASSLEISGKTEESEAWYKKIAASYPSTIYAKKAEGALYRIGIDGKPLAFSGTTLDGKKLDIAAYRGKVVLLTYWATWCQPCLDEVPQLQALLKQYRSHGFEIVGVNVDLSAEGLDKFIRDKKMNWPHIHEEGGLDSPPAIRLGILMPPAMFLLDKEGKVISGTATIEVLKDQIPKLLK